MFIEKGNEVRKKKFDDKGEKEEDVDDDDYCGVRGGSNSNGGRERKLLYIGKGIRVVASQLNYQKCPRNLLFSCFFRIFNWKII